MDMKFDLDQDARAKARVSPYRKLDVQVSTDTVGFTGVLLNVSSDGACIGIETKEKLPIYIGNRLLVRCRLNVLNEIWSDELFVGKVRWLKEEKDEMIFGIEFMDSDEFYHPNISTLGASGEAWS